jgi:diguanylate cyclase (GGDEF)-like protein
MDVLTLNFVNLYIALAASSMLWLLYRTEAKPPYLQYWTFAGIFLLLNASLGVLFLTTDQMPYWLAPAGANTCTIGFHLLLLAGFCRHWQRPIPSFWLVGVVMLAYTVNLSDFAQVSLSNRLLLNFPMIVIINLLSLGLLLRHWQKPQHSVYLVFALAFGLNAAQFGLRWVVVVANQLHLDLGISEQLLHSLGFFGLVAFELVIFSGCILLVKRQQQLALQHASERDQLTGILNRNSLEQKLHAEVQRCQRAGKCCSFIMFDIDYFKQVNDRFGHIIGDAAICHVVKVATEQLRPYDLMFRYGGEEFLVCLPETAAAEAVHIANRIRSHIEHSTLADCPQAQLTVSVGVASGGLHTPWHLLVSEADQALYQAKHSGRNQSCLFSAPQPAGVC